GASRGTRRRWPGACRDAAGSEVLWSAGSKPDSARPARQLAQPAHHPRIGEYAGPQWAGVDRHLSPRIAYWTSSFEFEMEGIASEVALLRQHFPRSVAWGLSHRHRLLLSQRRGYCLHPRLHLVFRAATRVLEPLFQLNHIFGALGDWFYLAGSRR